MGAPRWTRSRRSRLGDPPALFLRRRPAFNLVAAWVVLYWVPLTLATGLVDPHFRAFPGNMMRYWMPILPAIAIGGLGLVHTGACALLERPPDATGRGRRLAAATVLSLASFAAILTVHDIRDVGLYRGHGATQLYELRAWLDRNGATVDVVWTDRRTARLIPVLLADGVRPSRMAWRHAVLRARW